MQDFHCIKSPITFAFGQENLQQKVLVTAICLTLVGVSSLTQHSCELLYSENYFREPSTGFQIPDFSPLNSQHFFIARKKALNISTRIP